ncbi:uncharacterized protein RJT21DRAFT_527 [Scheffersomyces amazonensis]|uniref:uncharacterized protein n=1 Tax=Scheffersomyces amazonensis TaxID=1078765 RepID=UPI00315CD3CC
MKDILEYVDLNAVQRSTEFAITKLIEEPSYNFFNDPTQKQILNESWNTLIAQLPDPKDKESKLDRNRQNEEYRNDRFDIIVEVFNKIRHLYEENQHANEESVLLSRRDVRNLFGFCCCISVPQPRFTVQSKHNKLDKKFTNTNNPSSKFLNYKFNNCSKTSKKHFQIVPICDKKKYNDESLQKMFSKFKIDKAVLQQFIFLDKSYHPIKHVNQYMCHYLLYPLTLTLYTRLNDVERSCYPKFDAFEVPVSGIKNKRRYETFFLLRDKGIYNAFQNRNDKLNNTAFLKLADEIIYELKEKNSRIGFAVDMDCVLIC